MPYLIDGHNLIPKLGLRLESPDDELELVEILQEYCRLSRRNAEIYFDGAPAGQAGIRKYGVVTAHFVRAGMTADTAILARLKQLGRAVRNWSVVSSDRAVRSGARALHARVISSENFVGHLKHALASSKSRTGEKKLSEAELEEWLKLFDGEE